jgi:hypothetical protein|tara:strand:+ start:137 stop:388 length:252 start_codon:yes stop_codon:yes gene_type:complete
MSKVNLANLKRRIQNAKAQVPQKKGSSIRMRRSVAKNKFPALTKEIQQLSKAQKDSLFGVGTDPMLAFTRANFKYPTIKNRSK